VDDLADFLLARIAEDEAMARHAALRDPAWSIAEPSPALWGDDPRDSVVLAGGKPIASCNPEYGGGLVAEHIAHWDPERVIAECEAKRRVVEQFSLTRTMTGTAAVTPLLRLLGLPYADHPDYREEWRT
jgi:Family of unknown function (DUF6221)